MLDSSHIGKSAVAPATELVVSLLVHHADAHDSHHLQSNPRGYIFKTTHINIPSDVEFAVVENSVAVVNLVLPYYDLVCKSFPSEITAEDLSGVSGGFIGSPFWFGGSDGSDGSDGSGDIYLSPGLRLGGDIARGGVFQF